MSTAHLAGFSATKAVLAQFPPGTAFLVACSGGADSLALAVCAAQAGRVLKQKVGAVIVDHGLQPGSAAVAQRAAAQCRDLGLDPVEVRTVKVAQAGGPEAAARDARYAALAAARDQHGATAVLLGHTMDDQAETVLLGLARGSGPRSIQGMMQVRGPWIRPFLTIRRAQTEEICAQGGLEVWDDPTNALAASGEVVETPGGDAQAYVPKRTRVRHELLPLAQQVLGPGVIPALARTADLIQADTAALDEWAQRAYDQLSLPDAALPARPLAELPPAVHTRVIRTWLLRHGATPGDLKREHVEAVAQLVTNWHGQGPISIPGGVSVSRRDGILKVH